MSENIIIYWMKLCQPKCVLNPSKMFHFQHRQEVLFGGRNQPTNKKSNPHLVNIL